MQKTTTVPPIPNKTIPVSRVSKHEIPVAVPRLTLIQNNEVLIITLDEAQEQVVPSVPVPSKGTNVIPMEEDPWEQTQVYINKYNTRSSP